MFTLVSASPAPAKQQGAPARLSGVQGVQHAQQQQIRQGLKSGKLSKKQAARLEKGEKTIQGIEDRDKAKGPLTGAEDKQLKQDTQRETDAIKQAEDHNATPPTH
jgi:hypothetical protein